ncbi:4-hydroxybenzoate octaprenyltransferase [Rhodospirillaceae bacterium SYSU D60014]|uniref:4-hydroxybenzoate octaprenyltransferase n=1 Tax=Virgifigura deserti TaxID=2268457 RepID=UPI000E66DE64
MHEGFGTDPLNDAADIRPGDWIDRFAPEPTRPYLRLARLDRPIGTWLLLFPGWWAIALAAPPGSWPDWRLLVLFGIGAVVMRGAGCTFNDIVDRDFDARVARTATRPIPSGAVTVLRAAAFLGLQLAIGLAVLLSLNGFAIGLGVASLALIAIYPFMKRITYWPQAFLGLTFNWGALMGWAAVTGRLDPPALALYAAGIAWTMVYDTIYAHQDKEDDALIGVKSTALRFGAQTRPWLFGFAGVALLLFGASLHLAGIGWPGWIALALVAAHLAWQGLQVKLDDPHDCLTKFRANRWLGWILLTGIVLGRLNG